VAAGQNRFPGQPGRDDEDERKKEMPGDQKNTRIINLTCSKRIDDLNNN
jgi:hypothetical protein